MIDVAELVDVEKYPVFDLASDQALRVIEQAQSELRSQGAAELTGFVNPLGVSTLVQDAEFLSARSYHSEGLGTAYLDIPEADVPDGHPRRWLGRYAVGAVPYDLIPKTSALRRLYEWDPLMSLIATVLDRGPLFRYSDPFGALNLAVMRQGDELQWHFDQTDFVVSLAIQPPLEGGEFEVAPLIRDNGDERYDSVGELLNNEQQSTDSVVTLAMTPGTVLIFEGRNSLHRVTPIAGSTSRYVGLLAYDTKPGTTGTDLLRLARYGRTNPFENPPVQWPIS